MDASVIYSSDKYLNPSHTLSHTLNALCHPGFFTILWSTLQAAIPSTKHTLNAHFPRESRSASITPCRKKTTQHPKTAHPPRMSQSS